MAKGLFFVVSFFVDQLFVMLIWKFENANFVWRFSLYAESQKPESMGIIYETFIDFIYVYFLGRVLHELHGNL